MMNLDKVRGQHKSDVNFIKISLTYIDDDILL